MKLVQFRAGDYEAVGLLEGGSLIDLSRAIDIQVKVHGWFSPVPPLADVGSISGLLELGTFDVSWVRAVREFVKAHGLESELRLNIKDVTLLAPIARPPRIIALGLNYAAHAAEGGRKPPKEPIFFLKASTAVIGPDEPVVCPQNVGRIDHEVELAVVISREGRRIPRARAHEYIAGYTIMNDVTARDMQRRDMAASNPWFLSKSFDTFAPMGPCLVLPDEIQAPVELDLSLRVNGATKQKSNTRQLIFKIPDLIHRFSKRITLLPGDVISTGTPDGISPIQPGDVMEAEVRGIGVLRNPVVAGKQARVKAVLAFDIGGTKLAVGVVNDAGEVLAEAIEPTGDAASAESVVDALLRLAGDVVSRAGLRDRLAGAGVSFGGPVDFPRGATVTCHHLPGWEGFALRQVLQERTGLLTVMDNDANAAALGEATFGAAQGCPHVLYLTVSTGIGGGVIIDGRIHRGANSMAGEIGHTLVAPDGPLCSCGRRGCLEAVAAGPSIARAAREALGAGAASSLAAIPRAELTAKQVAEAALTDALAARIMDQAGGYLGLAIAAAVNLLNPNVVVIGGGVSGAGEPLFRPLREAVKRYAVPESSRDLRILPGGLGPRSALLGAAAMALTEATS